MAEDRAHDSRRVPHTPLSNNAMKIWENEAQEDLDYNEDYNTDRPRRTEASFERRPEH